MKRKLLLSLVLSSCFTVLYAQNRLGKVTVEELQATRSDIDSTAAAEIIYAKGSYVINFDHNGKPWLYIDVERKIKIYTKEGYSWADHEFMLYRSVQSESGSFSNAYTYNLINGKVEKTKLKKEGEFTEKIDEKWDKKKITLPNVREGSVVEYKYSIKTPFFSTMPEWFFQSVIPVKHSELTVITPEYFRYGIMLKPYLEINRVETTGPSAHGNFAENKTVYTAENIPPFKNEQFTPNINNYISSVAYELASYKNTSGFVTNVSTTWEDVVKTIYKSDHFGEELKAKGYFEKDMDQLLSQQFKSADEKMYAVFDFVRSRMTWNEKYGYNTRSGVKKAYAERTGNVAEINLMLTTMLRYAGFSAYPVLVSTRANGIAYFPNTSAYNYVVVAVEKNQGEDYVLFDATSKYTLSDIIPFKALNWVGRLVKEGGYSYEVNLMPRMVSRSLVNCMADIDIDQSIFKGKSRKISYDYYAYLYREQFGRLAKESRIEQVEKNNNRLEVIDYEMVNVDSFDKPVIENMDFEYGDLIEIIGDRVYLGALLFYSTITTPFKSDKREYPIDFTFPRQDKYVVSINIPNNYQVESLPESISQIFENGKIEYKIFFKEVNQLIQVTSQLDINGTIVSPAEYPYFKEFYNKMVEKQNEKIVLKRI